MKTPTPPTNSDKRAENAVMLLIFSQPSTIGLFLCESPGTRFELKWLFSAGACERKDGDEKLTALDNR